MIKNRKIGHIGLAVNEKTMRRLSLSWGVKPTMCEVYPSVEVLFYRELLEAVKLKKLKKGDNVVLTGGQINGQPGNTNMIKLETVK